MILLNESVSVYLIIPIVLPCLVITQEIDELLSGGLTDEDEEAVLAELEALTKGDEIKVEDVQLPTVPDNELPEIGKIVHQCII